MNLETLESELKRTLEAIDAIGRPDMDFGNGLAAVAESRWKILAWDKTNPEAHAEYLRLCAKVGPLEREINEARFSSRLFEKALRVMESSGAGERAQLAVVSAAQTEALAAAREWLIQRKTWLALLGGTGTGKTVAAVWAMREAARQGESVAFRTASALSRLSGFNEGAAELERLAKVSLLVLDDVGAEAVTAWGAGLLQDLLDQRHQGFRKTIVTSNLSANDFKARIGERMADRIREDGRVVLLGGKSLRKLQAAP